MRRLIAKRLVVIESPYAGDVDTNVEYARACVLDSLRRNESPYASHLLYPQSGILDDSVPDERELGMEAGLAWGDIADARVVYVDLGISPGMKRAIKRSQQQGQPVEYRQLGGDYAYRD